MAIVRQVILRGGPLNGKVIDVQIGEDFQCVGIDSTGRLAGNLVYRPTNRIESKNGRQYLVYEYSKKD